MTGSGVPAGLQSALETRYTISREIGAGGMATVYLAHDIRHDRDVAIKVLHPDLGAALGSERFLTEIRTTARLQHPHILPLLDSGDANGLLYYVMPLVSGETLRARLDRERQLPVLDAVRIAREVADALSCAHSHSVIHRDIKPENILLQDGHALVADFGIALAVESAGGARMTQTGLSLGTPQYMSPEQAMGERTIDARSDIYALGAVTYEMLVGEPPFTGPSVQAVVSRLITEEPRGITAQRKAVSPGVEAAVLHALEKLPADRFSTAAQFAAALDDDAPTSVHRNARTTGTRTPARGVVPLWRRPLTVVSMLALIAIALAASQWKRFGATNDVPVERRYVSLGDVAQVRDNRRAGRLMALSPDGSIFAFLGDTIGRVWVKRGDVLDPAPLPGTDHASDLTFSPDGKWIGYVSGGQLRKVRPEGGPSIGIADSVGTGYGIAWLDDNTIVFPGARVLGLRRVAATGGRVSVVLADSTLHGDAPMLVTPLPDSRGVLFERCASNCVTSSLRVLDFATGRQEVLVDAAGSGWYLPTGDILYFGRDGLANLVPFDVAKLKLRGVAVPVLSNVLAIGTDVQLTWSSTGKMIYGVRGGTAGGTTIRYANLKGMVTTADASLVGQFNSFAMSPDGKRAAISVVQPGGSFDIWIKQLDRGPFTRLTFGGRDRRPAWSPDGRNVAFVRDSPDGLSTTLYERPTDGSGSEHTILQIDRMVQELTFSHDGKWILVRTDDADAGHGDILAVGTAPGSTRVPVATSRFTELQPAISPDDRWVAYVSNESGQDEVFVTPFPNGGGSHWQVSDAGGGSPVWSRDGKQLYFLDATNRLVVAQVATSPTLHVLSLTPLFDASRFTYVAYHQAFDVMPDGRFIFTDRAGDSTSTAVRLVQVDNWFSDLRAKAKQ